jgi:lantibiotic leader peptide-processing serine protease
MVKPAALATAVVVAGIATTPVAAHAAAPRHTYVVVYAAGAPTIKAHRAIRRAHGRIVRENLAVGVATVRSSAPRFLTVVRRSIAVAGASRNRRIGKAPGTPAPRRLEREHGASTPASAAAPAAAPADEPLAPRQWDMRMLRATPAGSYASQPGSHAVRVGIIDTGIDASHPDIAPNFDSALSRNFTVDDPVVDGPCAEDPDGSCNDPANVDEDGHGTHVAGTIGAPLNGIGIGGVAPGVDLVNLRAGQDSGFFFLQPTVDALTYAGDHGIDVVNMSFFIDPWLYNCRSNKADSRAEQEQQRTIIEATQRALDYAHARGVTMVAALGNEHTDIGHPTVDAISPDYPPGSERQREVDNGCLDLPTEGRHVIGVSALGPSARKAYYSNYGTEQTDVSAPGGDRRDFFGTPQYDAPETRILAPMPAAVALASPASPLIVRDCTGGTCAYYQWLQGTSMAAPHAVGVAALIVAQFGRPDGADGLTLDPDDVQRRLERSAAKTPCPDGNPFTYPDPDLPDDFSAECHGGTGDNGFYGHGIVDALGAVSAR